MNTQTTTFIYELSVPISELRVPIAMTSLTHKEQEALLLIFKNFSVNYNANSLSKEIGVTPRGALKLLKHLESLGLLIGKQLGKAVFYKINFNDPYTGKMVELSLIEEARKNATRWLREFEGIFKETSIVILFGSVIRKADKASDVDVLFVVEESKFKQVRDFISSKNDISPKPIHPMFQSHSDILKNLKERSPALVSAIKTGYVLHGHEKLIEVMKDVTVL